MAELYDMREEAERVILVAVSTDDGDDTEESVDELAELVKTAGATAIDRIIQSCNAYLLDADHSFMAETFSQRLNQVEGLTDQEKRTIMPGTRCHQ